MFRRATDEDIRKAIAYARKVMPEVKRRLGHIGLRGCPVRLDEKGYTVIDRYGRGRNVR